MKVASKQKALYLPTIKHKSTASKHIKIKNILPSKKILNSVPSIINDLNRSEAIDLNYGENVE